MASDPQYEKEQKLSDLNDTLQKGIEYAKEGDREIRYRSLEDLIRIRNLLLSSLRQRKPKSIILPSFRKGL